MRAFLAFPCTAEGFWGRVPGSGRCFVLARREGSWGLPLCTKSTTFRAREKWFDWMQGSVFVCVSHEFSSVTLFQVLGICEIVTFLFYSLMVAASSSSAVKKVKQFVSLPPQEYTPFEIQLIWLPFDFSPLTGFKRLWFRELFVFFCLCGVMFSYGFLHLSRNRWYIWCIY